MKWELPRRDRPLNIVLFSGGRGSGALSKQLVRRPDVSLTIAINGYDDGLSTGEVRRFLGDALGPSDFRKNASRVARELASCPPALIDLLDLRLPQGCTAEAARRAFCLAGDGPVTPDGAFETRVAEIAGGIGADARRAVADRLSAFETERTERDRAFDFSDCCIGNLVFAGSFLVSGRRFNDAIDDYCALARPAAGLVDNVTDGTNAFLVALDVDDRLLGSEGEIVDAKRRNRIKDIYLIDHALDESERERLAGWPVAEILRDARVPWRATGAEPAGRRTRVAQADLIIYAPGTQHSSLFPSYLTPGLSDAIASNLRRSSCSSPTSRRTPRSSAAAPWTSFERAVFYLQEKGRLPHPDAVPDHPLPDQRPRSTGTSPPPYMPLGKLDTLEDPRLVRVGQLRGGRRQGRHDALKVLGPVRRGAAVARRAPQGGGVAARRRPRSTRSSQTLLEMVRAGIGELPLDVTVLLPRATNPLRRDVGGRAAVPGRRRCRWLAARRACGRRLAAKAATTWCCSSRRGCTSVRTSSRCCRTCRPGASTPSGEAGACRSATSASPCACDTVTARGCACASQVGSYALEPRLPGALRPLHLRYAVGRSRRSHGRTRWRPMSIRRTSCSTSSCSRCCCATAPSSSRCRCASSRCRPSGCGARRWSRGCDRWPMIAWWRLRAPPCRREPSATAASSAVSAASSSCPAAGGGSRLGSRRPQGARRRWTAARCSSTSCELYRARRGAGRRASSGPASSRRCSGCAAAADVVVRCVVQADADRHARRDPAAVGRCAQAPTDWVWITWCDQVAIRAADASRRSRRPCTARGPTPAIVLPTVARRTRTSTSTRDARGRIVARPAAARGRRDAGDVGRATWGCSLSTRAYPELLPRVRRRGADAGASHRRAQLPAVHPVAVGAASGRRRDVPVPRTRSRRSASTRRRNCARSIVAARAPGGHVPANVRMKTLSIVIPGLQRGAVHRHAARADLRGRSLEPRRRARRSSSSTTARATGRPPSPARRPA